MEILKLILLVCTGFISGFYGTIAGGGALLTIPVLIFLGLPVSMAIGTNRFSSFGSIFTGLYKFGKEKKIAYKLAFPLAIIATTGSVIGSSFVVQINEEILKKIIAIFLIFITLVLIFHNKAGLKPKKSLLSLNNKIIGYILIFFIGIYAGFFGAAYATMIMYVLIFLFGLTFLRSAGTIKIIALPLTIATTIIFVLHGKVYFFYGGALLVGRALGAYLGAGFGLKKGEGFAKLLFIIVVLITGIKLLIGS